MYWTYKKGTDAEWKAFVRELNAQNFYEGTRLTVKRAKELHPQGIPVVHYDDMFAPFKGAPKATKAATAPKIVEPIPNIQAGQFSEYLKLQIRYDNELKDALSSAARRVNTIMDGLRGETFSNDVRAASYDLRRVALRQVNADVWGHAKDIIGEGIEDMKALGLEQSIDFLKLMTAGMNESERQIALIAANSSIANYQQRLTNGFDLSERVYNNQALAAGKIDKIVNNGILLGQSAKEIADSVVKFIRPDVPGGASYAAMRLGRTELNNAYHDASRARFESEPWVDQVRWNKSGSHKLPDICDTLAARSPWKKRDVPAKPHPHCLCYITAITPTRKDFLKSLQDGKYDDWIEEQGLPRIDSAYTPKTPSNKDMKSMSPAKKADSEWRHIETKRNGERPDWRFQTPEDAQEWMRKNLTKRFNRSDQEAMRMYSTSSREFADVLRHTDDIMKHLDLSPDDFMDYLYDYYLMEASPEDLVKMYKGLENIVKKNKLDEQLTVKRFYQSSKDVKSLKKDILDSLKSGKPYEFTDNDFVSTTLGNNLSFINQPTMVMEIEVPKGTGVVNIGGAFRQSWAEGFGAEAELILERGGTFVIYDVDPTNLIFRAKFVPSSGKLGPSIIDMIERLLGRHPLYHSFN